VRRKLTPSRAAAIFFMAVMATACGRNDPSVGDCGAVRSQYPEWPDERWRSYDLETQYRIYICANQGVLPHRGGEALIAAGGAPMAHFLAAKLDATNYDLTIEDIVIVFAVMQTNRTYDATTDPALMALLQRKVASLSGPGDSAVREWSERYLHTIQTGPGAPLP
jgi:hypothetical protein